MDVGASKEAVALKEKVTERDSKLQASAKAYQAKQKELTEKIQTLDAAIRGLNSADVDDVADVVRTAQIAGLVATKKKAKVEFARNRENYRQEKSKINREASAEIDALGLALKKKKAELALKRLPPPQVSFIDDLTLSDPLMPKRDEIAGKVNQIENQQAFLRLKAMSKIDPKIFTEDFKTALKAEEMVIRLVREDQKAKTKEDAETRKKNAEKQVLEKAVEKALTAAGTTSGSSTLPALQDLITELSKKARVEQDQEKKKALGLQIAEIREKLAGYREAESELDKLAAVNEAKRVSRQQALKAALGEFTSSKQALAESLNASNQVNHTNVDLISSSPSPTSHIVGPSDSEHVVLMKKHGDEVSLDYTQILRKAGAHDEDPPVGGSSSYVAKKWYKLDDGSYFYVESIGDDGKAKGNKYKMMGPASSRGAASK